jgi:hypothetical protein
MTFVALFSINGTFAWFAKNDTVKADGMDISVSAPDNISASFSSHGVLTMETVNSAVYYTYDTEEEVFDLPVDDPAGIGYDKYLKALVVCISVDVTAERVFSLAVECTGETVEKINDNLFSNVTKYALATSSSENTVYKTQESKSFISFSNSEPTHAGSITLASNIRLTPEMNTIYLIIEYNDDFIDYINNSLMGESNKTVTYKNDIKFTLNTV